MKIVFNTDKEIHYRSVTCGQIFLVEDTAYIRTESGHVSLKTGVTGEFEDYSNTTKVQALLTIYPYNTDKV